jgi:MFS family permease
MIITLSLVVGVTDALSMPSFQSIVPSIVERDRIPSAFALNSTQFNLSRILGPSIAGILVASIGAIGCFGVNAASYVPFILVALWILPRGTPPLRSREIFQDAHLFSALRDILSDVDMRSALVTVFLSSLLSGPLITFCPC